MRAYILRNSFFVILTRSKSKMLRAADRQVSLIVEALLIAVYLGNERLLIDIRDTINRTPYLSYTIQLVLPCCLRPPRSAGACPAEPVRAGESQPKRGLFSTEKFLNFNSISHLYLSKDAHV
jgi:hypothetical protein